MLNDDTWSYIFSLIQPSPKYFLISKHLYKLRTKYLSMHLTHLKLTLPKYRDSTISCLYRYYQNNLKDDMCDYRKYILYFISNKNRKTTIYPCVNNYHRMLVHKHIVGDSQELLHETIIKGTKNIRACKNCKSPNINIQSDEYGEYYCSCNNCDNGYSGYTALDNFVCYTSLPQKMIRITKK